MMPVNADRGIVLYIEDNPDNRMLVRRVLTAEGFSVVEAYDAVSAFDSLNSTTPDIILMDINMPEVDGYTLTSQIRKLPEYDHIPIVALTANVMKGDREKSLQAGCDGYIQKPIDIDTITQLLERFINSKKRLEK